MNRQQRLPIPRNQVLDAFGRTSAERNVQDPAVTPARWQAAGIGGRHERGCCTDAWPAQRHTTGRAEQFDNRHRQQFSVSPIQKRKLLY
ncbi:MAG: hypothetical protein D4R77_02215 [Planctomycetaceae bacterium]|nr:MAG: hypothetical protein D4R77_02215 [Planctomycetaceae bacterium]